MNHTTSTPLIRRIIVESPKGEYLTQMRTRDGDYPLTNPGHFAKGIYCGVVHPDTGMATISEDWRA